MDTRAGTLADSDRQNVEARVASALNNAAAPDGFTNLIGSLTQADRDRINTSHYSDMSALKEAVDKFRSAFHDRYGENFDLTAQKLGGLDIRGAGNDVYVRISAQGRGMGMDDAKSDAKSDMKTDAMADPKADPKSDAKTGMGDMGAMGQMNDKGRADARPEWAHAGAALTGAAHLVKGTDLGNDWRIDVPDSVTKEGLASSLQSRLTQLAKGSQQWPKDADQAYRHIGRDLLQAITQPATTGLSSDQ
jgi:hypothetical protein